MAAAASQHIQSQQSKYSAFWPYTLTDEKSAREEAQKLGVDCELQDDIHSFHRKLLACRNSSFFPHQHATDMKCVWVCSEEWKKEHASVLQFGSNSQSSSAGPSSATSPAPVGMAFAPIQGGSPGMFPMAFQQNQMQQQYQMQLMQQYHMQQQYKMQQQIQPGQPSVPANGASCIRDAMPANVRPTTPTDASVVGGGQGSALPNASQGKRAAQPAAVAAGSAAKKQKPRAPKFVIAEFVRTAMAMMEPECWTGVEYMRQGLCREGIDQTKSAQGEIAPFKIFAEKCVLV